ncbi:uncharacterized protein [Phyllobates terribilis]|uniref:uncharacterized protein isoform X2 n=1 Tax=Phyllobates terribilis TaxID=111132 RepID=UPI003CCA9ADA
MDSDELRRFVKDFSFDRCKRGNQGFNRILIQLFGLLGHGKSSFINTCIYVWEDCEFQNWSKAVGAYGGHTTERIPYKLTETLTLVDNRGCATMEDKESGVIFAQLGVVPIVVLTYKTAGSLTEMEGIFRDIGVDRIFSFENYTTEDHMKTRGKHEEVLKFLCEVIKDVQFRVEQPRDPSEEMKMRRKFVLNYIHECGMKEQQRKVEKKKAVDHALLEKRHQQKEEEMKKRREAEQRQHDEEFKRLQEELQWERERDRERQEEELRAQTGRQKKKKTKTSIFGFFSQKK